MPLANLSPWPPTWLTPVPQKAIDAGEGDLVIEFAESFGIITKDSVAGATGEQLVLRDWQKHLIENIFAHENGGLRHRINLVGMPRKNGKSAIGSVLALYSLILGPRGGEVYSVAAEKQQARIVFADARKMIEASEELSAITKLYRDAIEMPSFGSVYRVLSAEAYSKEGLNPHFVLFDELHAQPSRELFDVMSLAMGSRGSLATLVAITTAGVKADSTGHDSIAYSLYQYGKQIANKEIDDPTFFMSWWEAPADADHREYDTWLQANPGLRDVGLAPIVDVADFESAVKRTPEAEFRIKRCNQWVSSQMSWLPNGTWETLGTDIELNLDDEIILGFDGSYSGDATVIVGCTIPKDDSEKAKIFLVKAWEKNFGVDNDLWRVDIAEVEQTIVEFCAKYRNVKEIACDPYRWQRSMQVLEEEYGLPIVEFPNTPSRMIPACAKFYDAVLEERLEHENDGTLSRHFDNAIIKLTPAGPYIKKDAKNSPRKIDGAIATIMAYDRATVGRLEEVVPQFFI